MATPETFRKLTDPVIPTQNGAVALDDLLHTVDVSDTSKGAAGTSKRTTVQKIVDVVQSSLNLESGEWTPTLDNASGSLSAPSVLRAFYSVTGNIVNCTIYGLVTVDFSSVIEGAFDFTFPIIPLSDNAIGISNFDSYSNGLAGSVQGKTIKLRALEIILALPIETGFVATFQYKIN